MTDFSKFFNSHFEIKTNVDREIQDESFKMRYQVYCLERGMKSSDGFTRCRERDEFDSNSLHGIVQHRDSNRTMGTVRLVRSRHDIFGQRFPLEEAFPSLLREHGLNDRILPRSTTAEISRLAISKISQRDLPQLGGEQVLSRAGGYFNGRCYPLVTFGLFVALMRLSARHDITHWLAIMEPSLLRLLSRFGIAFQRIGGVVDFHGRRQPCYGRVEDIRARVRDVERDLFDLAEHHTHRVKPMMPERAAC